jgi:hypothetical protein
MNPNERPTIDNDATSEPAHPAPAQSPRSLDDKGQVQQHDVPKEREQWDQSREETERPKRE